MSVSSFRSPQKPLRQRGTRSLSCLPSPLKRREDQPCPLRRLGEEEIEEVLSHLQGWSRQGSKLHRQYHFSSFERALGFLSGLALIAQAAGHPLEESEVYDCVNVDLTSPEVGGITALDVALAYQADALATVLHVPFDGKHCREEGKP